MTDFLELARRCEKAERPDKELGFEILLACGWRRTCVGHFHGPLYQWSDDGKRSYREDNLPCPTGSIDAAMTLVPEGKYWVCGFGKVSADEPFGGAQIIEPESSEEIAEGQGATVALALCAASLRARSNGHGARARSCDNLTTDPGAS